MAASVTAVALRDPWLLSSERHWEVQVAGSQPGLTRVTDDNLGLHIRVGDRHPGSGPSAVPRQLRSMLAADLRADGSVHLVTRCAPPALIVAAEGPWLFPADAGVRGECVLAPGDLLVMCSAAVLDAHPDGIVALLSAGPDTARDTDPAQLVATVLSGATSGAVAVARRLPA